MKKILAFLLTAALLLAPAFAQDDDLDLDALLGDFGEEFMEADATADVFAEETDLAVDMDAAEDPFADLFDTPDDEWPDFAEEEEAAPAVADDPFADLMPPPAIEETVDAAADVFAEEPNPAVEEAALDAPVLENDPFADLLDDSWAAEEDPFADLLDAPVEAAEEAVDEVVEAVETDVWGDVVETQAEKDDVFADFDLAETPDPAEEDMDWLEEDVFSASPMDDVADPVEADEAAWADDEAAWLADEAELLAEAVAEPEFTQVEQVSVADEVLADGTAVVETTVITPDAMVKSREVVKPAVSLPAAQSTAAPPPVGAADEVMAW